MLASRHKDILIYWLDLLHDFQKVISQEKVNFSQLQIQWEEIQKYLNETIVSIDCEELETQSQKTNWQIWQTETYRYLRLLNTEILFWRSSRQQATKKERFTAIKERLTDAIELTEKLLQGQK